jgi:hypothetical protein
MTGLEIHTQQDLEGRWMFWIVVTGNQAAIAKSCRLYSTKSGAVKAARRVAGPIPVAR